MNPTLYRYMRRNVPQKGTLYDFDRAQPGMEDAYERAREGAGPVAIDEAEQGQLDVPQQAALPGAEPEELEEFPQPFTPPPTVEAQAPVVASRATAEDDDEAGARRMDANTALARGFETAGRQFLAGMTRTPVLDTLTEQSNAVGQARTAAKTRAEQLRAAAEEARRSRETDDKLMNSESSRILDLARAAALSRDIRRGLDPDLENRRLDLKEQEIRGDDARGNRLLDIKEKAAGRRPVAKAPAAPSAGKPLPPSLVAELAKYDVAEKEMDDILAKFEETGAAGAWAGFKGALTKALDLRGTDAARYNAEAHRKMQSSGSILEGGKMQGGDEIKYEKMLPRTGDSKELAREKAMGVKESLRANKTAQIKALKEAGYAVPEDGAAPVAPRPQGDADVPAGKVTVTSPTGKTLTVSAKTAELLKSGKVPWPK